MVDALVRGGEPAAAQRGHEFELADMSREFAEAYAYLGDVEQWSWYRDEALDRARRGKYFEIVHRLESHAARREPQDRRAKSR